MFSLWVMVSIIMSFEISVVAGRFVIPFLEKNNFTQPINKIGPTWHENKKNTPTMGGIIFIISIVITSFFIFILTGGFSKGEFASTSSVDITKLFSGVVMALAFSFVGFLDDYIKVAKKRNLGLSELQKTLIQLLISVVYLVTIFIAGDHSTTIYLPFIGFLNLGFVYYPFAIFAIFSTVNAVNITDGIDGLCSSVTAVAAIAFIAVANIFENNTMAVFSGALAGGTLGFLIYNKHPAKTFMGDTGSMFLGGMVAAIAFGLNMPILILFIGIAYVIDILTVLIQRLYYKATKKRIFKMTPIHHSLEISGYSEDQIVLIFILITAVGSVLGVFMASRI